MVGTLTLHSGKNKLVGSIKKNSIVENRNIHGLQVCLKACGISQERYSSDGCVLR